MTDDTQKTGNGKAWVGGLTVFLATFVLHRMEIDHIDFAQFGMTPDVFKGMIETILVTFLSWITPSHFTQSITEVILFWRKAFKDWRDAANNPLEGDTP